MFHRPTFSPNFKSFSPPKICTKKSFFSPRGSAGGGHAKKKERKSEDRGCLEEGCLGLPGVLPDIFWTGVFPRKWRKRGKEPELPDLAWISQTSFFQTSAATLAKTNFWVRCHVKGCQKVWYVPRSPGKQPLWHKTPHLKWSCKLSLPKHLREFRGSPDRFTLWHKIITSEK